MIQYLIINIILTIGALSISRFMHIPQKIKLIVLMSAVIAWLIPFSLISIELSHQSVTMLPTQWIQMSDSPLLSTGVKPSNFSWFYVFWVLISIGLMRFLYDLFTTQRYINQLLQQSCSVQSQQNIRTVQNFSGAFISGYINPIIWLDERLLNSEKLTTVIIHEQQHINNNDQFWLLIITFVQRLFWFNPLAYLLCLQTRQSIELNCDEICKRKIGKVKYQSHLAQLMLSKQQAMNVSLSNQIIQNKRFNLHRIQQLEKENTMNTTDKTKLGAFAALTIMMIAYSLVTIAQEEKTPSIADDQVLLSLKIQRNGEEPTALSLLTKQGEMANVTFDNHDFAFVTLVTEAEPTYIYTEIVISKITDGIKSELASPSIVTYNNQWGAFKFGGEDTYFDISIMAKTSSDLNPEEEAVENHLNKNDPAPQWLSENQ